MVSSNTFFLCFSLWLVLFEEKKIRWNNVPQLSWKSLKNYNSNVKNERKTFEIHKTLTIGYFYESKRSSKFPFVTKEMSHSVSPSTVLKTPSTQFLSLTFLCPLRNPPWIVVMCCILRHVRITRISLRCFSSIKKVYYSYLIILKWLSIEFF